jgi:diguanylate cyclase (GGDEF)-like protein
VIIVEIMIILIDSILGMITMQQNLTVGVLTDSTDGKFFGSLLLGIHEFLSGVNCRILVVQTPGTNRGLSNDNDTAWNEALAWQQVDGWIVIHRPVNEAYIRRLRAMGKGVVNLHAVKEILDCPSVDVDNEGGTAQAVHHLIQLGHSRIAFAGAIKRPSISKRYHGYLSAMEQAGLSIDPALVFPIDDNMQMSARSAVPRMIGDRLSFTAVVAGTDRNAIGIMEGLKELGIRVPGDVAVIGFDNIDSAQESDPPLSSITPPNHQVGYEGARILYQILTQGKYEGPPTLLLPTVLVPRDSTDAKLCGENTISANEDNDSYRYATRKYYEEALMNSNEIALNLIHHGLSDDDSLSWLRWTNFTWGCLGLWVDKEKTKLRIPYIYDPSNQSSVSAEAVYSVEQFPPLDQIGQGKTGKELFRIHPVSSTRKDWGVLVLRGQVNPTSFYYGETVYKQWAALVGVALDRKASEEQISYLAYHDPVTGLFNRTYLYEQLPIWLQESQSKNKIGALFLLDLDNFKIVNDTLGHPVGDKLLQQVANFLLAFVGEGGIVTRLGGDEFVIVLTEVENQQHIFDLSDELLRKLALPIQLDGKEFYVSASMGISRYPIDGSDADELIKCADTAMYRAKYLGKNKVETYNSSMAGPLHERLYVENSLRKAIENGELELYYQPQVDMQRGQLLGVEALMRWNSPDRGQVPPNDFIPLAEETGLIVPMGRWLVSEAAKQLRAWHQAGYSNLCMAINVSAKEFRQRDFVTNVIEILSTYKIDPLTFCLEITETTAIEDLDYSREQLQKLINHGVQIAMDDFGTGFSSLSLLKQLSLHIIKIDRSFIADLTRSEDDVSIVKAIIAMSHSLKLKVLAEGVETIRQVERLQQLRCDYAQGYHWGMPVPADQITRLLQTGRL